MASSISSHCVPSLSLSCLSKIKSKSRLPLSPPLLVPLHRRGSCRFTSTSIRAFGSKNNNDNNNSKAAEEYEEVEEDVPWIQEKALDFVEFSGSVTKAIPGPRVAHTSLPWFLAVPLAFLGITFVTSLVKTYNKFTSPRARRRKLVGKNAALNNMIDQVFEKGRDALQPSALEDVVNKTGFPMEDVFRKYIRYVFNDKPFNADTVADLIQLRKASLLTDSQVAQVLNEISRRIVKDKGPVVMDASGYTERGFKRKLAVQALFGKVFYLSELPEFCSRDSSLIVKEIFGVTDEDADKLRIQTLTSSGDLEALDKMISDVFDSEDDGES